MEGKFSKSAVGFTLADDQMAVYYNMKILNSQVSDNYLESDPIGRFSLTKAWPAQSTTNHIKQILKKKKLGVVIDAGAGIGGNTLSFAHNADQVIAIEKDATRSHCLAVNVKKHGLDSNTRVIHGDIVFCIEDTMKGLNESQKTVDCIFFDPPWGGPDYKTKSRLRLHYNDIPIEVLFNEIISQYNKIIRVLTVKLPLNYDVAFFKEHLSSQVRDCKLDFYSVTFDKMLIISIMVKK